MLKILLIMEITFETPRLFLRPFTLDDVEAFYHLNNDPDVNKYLPKDERNASREKVRELIHNNTILDYERYGFGRLVIVYKEAKETIGFTGLKYLPELEEVDVGYRIAKKYWGQGIVMEGTIPIMEHGFTQLGLHRIIALAYPENKASIRVMEKLGMTYEKNIWLEGDELVYYAKEKNDKKSYHKTLG